MAGTRIAPVVDPVVEMLKRHQLRDEPNPYGLVWHRTDGNPITRHDDAASWRLVLGAAKQPPVDPYSCRHSTATLLLERGVPEEVRMAIMGHNSRAAQRFYAHVDQTQSRPALKKLKGLLALGD